MLLVGDRIPAGLSRMVQFNIFAIRAQPLRLPIFPASFLKRCAVRRLNLHEPSHGVFNLQQFSLPRGSSFQVCRCFPSSLNFFLKLTRFIRFGHNRPEPVSKLFLKRETCLKCNQEHHEKGTRPPKSTRTQSHMKNPPSESCHPFDRKCFLTCEKRVRSTENS